jgi:hypothetical protein
MKWEKCDWISTRKLDNEQGLRNAKTDVEIGQCQEVWRREFGWERKRSRTELNEVERIREDRNVENKSEAIIVQ